MATDTHVTTESAQPAPLVFPRYLPSLVVEAVFDAYLQTASPPACVAIACRRRWLAQHTPLAGAPEFCRAARRFARKWLPIMPPARVVDGVALVTVWQGCDLGAPSLGGAGTLTLVGSRDCGGKNAAACGIVAGMRGQLDRLYVARILGHTRGSTCCDILPDCEASVHTATLLNDTAADVVDVAVADHKRAPFCQHESVAVLIEACDRYVDNNDVGPVDDRRRDLMRFADSVAAAKRCGIHVVATVSGASASIGGPHILRDGVDRFVLVVPDAGRRHDVAHLFAPLTHYPPSTLLALMAVVDRFDALVFERDEAPTDTVSVWVRRQKCR
ncbi:hypothetical protein pqer_cds_1057 [Pandoravirus quercus]|uniref:Uncharacterized protein n=1 Tax=Pandoravirus quercus TaxID=2107709 RepID=A0A2U7UAM1_9VIRU|nr:hypothetical protein pqer_cds_1057 [Pandoravirus quercus]AVK75479.1 hypothetical protein pqer_cds_1057 [Pandoravirus quercus]